MFSLLLIYMSPGGDVGLMACLTVTESTAIFKTLDRRRFLSWLTSPGDQD